VQNEVRGNGKQRKREARERETEQNQQRNREAILAPGCKWLCKNVIPKCEQ